MALRGGLGVRFRSSRGAGPGATAPVAPPKDGPVHTLSDLDRSRLSDTRSAENDRIGADTDPEYRIDVSLVQTIKYTQNMSKWPATRVFTPFMS